MNLVYRRRVIRSFGVILVQGALVEGAQVVYVDGTVIGAGDEELVVTLRRRHGIHVERVTATTLLLGSVLITSCCSSIDQRGGI